MRSYLAPLIVTPLLLAAPPVLAQSNPSADQIISSLKPTGNLTLGGTRGIRLAAPTGTEAPSPQQIVPASTGQPHAAAGHAVTHATSVAASAPVAKGPSVNLTVNFANGSAELTPQAIATLDELGRALASKDLETFKFRIEGHTDTVGSKDYNQSLSQRRADAVVNYIETKYGVQPARLQAVGMGEEGLLVPTPEQTPEPRNRRVEVINLGA